MRGAIWLLLSAGGLLLAASGPTAFPQATGEKKKAALLPQVPVEKKEPEAKKVQVGPGVFVEIENKKAVRVLVESRVCLREGILEHLLTRKRGKEHESILEADIDARALHSALLLTGATAGTPITFRPKEIPPRGTSIKIHVAYINDAGKVVKVPAREWIRHIKTKKDLHTDWVFAGSQFVVHPDDPGQVYYFANDGDVICVSNFEAALLDLPILSSASDNEYEAHTARIPPVGTPVLVILEPAEK